MMANEKIQLADGSEVDSFFVALIEWRLKQLKLGNEQVYQELVNICWDEDGTLSAQTLAVLEYYHLSDNNAISEVAKHVIKALVQPVVVQA